MADIMQTPQGPDDRGLPVQPVVAGSANQTNARTGGVVGPTLDPIEWLRFPRASLPPPVVAGSANQTNARIGMVPAALGDAFGRLGAGVNNAADGAAAIPLRLGDAFGRLEAGVNNAALAEAARPGASPDPGADARIALFHKLNPPTAYSPGPATYAPAPQGSTAYSPGAVPGPSPADHAKVALGYVLSGETPQVRPGTPAHAAAPAQPAYEQPGYYPDASAGAPGSSGYENAWNGAHPDNQLAARGAYIPPPPGQTESQRLHEQYGIHPDDHALASHAAANPHMYSNGAFTNIFAGKPIDYVQRLVAMMQPPSMEDQARRAAVQASGQDAARNAQVSGTDAEQQSQRAGAAREGLLEEILRTIYGGYYTKPKK